MPEALTGEEPSTEHKDVVVYYMQGVVSLLCELVSTVHLYKSSISKLYKELFLRLWSH